MRTLMRGLFVAAILTSGATRQAEQCFTSCMQNEAWVHHRDNRAIR